MRIRESIIGYYSNVLWRILLVFLLYSCSRAFFVWYNGDILNPLSAQQYQRIFSGGLLFDSAAIMYTNILYLFLALLPAPFVFKRWYQHVVKFIYVLVNFAALSANLADTVYFRFTMRRTSSSFLTEFQGDVNFGKIFLESITLYWYLFVAGLVFLAILVYLSGRYTKESEAFFSHRMFTSFSNYKPYLYQGIALVIAAPFIIIGIRGGVTRTMRPITVSNAGDYVDRAIHTSAVLNTPFSVIRTLGKNYFTAQNFYPSYESMEKIFTPVHNPALEQRDTTSLFPVTDKKMNVVFIIMESFGAESMQFLNKTLDVNYTPFLDSIRKRGISCTNAFANGRKSVDAVPSIFASVPSMMESFAVTPYANDQLEGLPRILDTLGYYTAFFHGAPNNSMGIRAMTNLCGIKNYYGKDEYGNNSDYDGSWGIWDHKFLPYVAKTISTFKEPFFASVFTLSSHHPYKIPNEYKDVFPKGDMPILETVAYADNALKEFFAAISKETWFENTIFVLTPDHSTWRRSAQSKYTTLLGTTEIPIIYYAPGFIPEGEYNEPTQQIDIMPTLLGIFGYDKPYFAFGRNLAAEGGKPFAINYGGGQYQLVVGDTLYVRDGKELNSMYRYKTDSILTENLYKKDVQLDSNALANDKFFKALIQQYTNRLIEDKMLPQR